MTLLKKCPNCKKYTLKESCTKCKKETSDAHYKFIKIYEKKIKLTTEQRSEVSVNPER
ncbi:MAG: nucleolar RNA-binding Nop10p family protein [Nanoarchaeota archaeon]|nr:nucleolar RNA-binding Nop10p family protein [Nanoarchaeota archaeon]